MSPWVTTTTTYEAVGDSYTKALPCPVCGKKVRRQRRFQQTLSPFNKNGYDRKKAWAAVRAEAAEWQAKPEICTPCRDGGTS